ncbi:MAG: MBL fold metallo-hydrolase [Oscillospiraceae bacterium]|nr:MBL fold metallo-hydrolase [Oscillospiraceae bacterium]
MKITTLGTSHGNHTYCRFNSSTLIEVGDAVYLIDAGVPVDATLTRRGTDFNAIRGIFITHMHGDHAAGLPNMVKYIEKFAKNRQSPAAIFLPEEEAIEPLGAWCRALHLQFPSPLFTMNTTRPGFVYEDEYISVTAYETRHLRMSGLDCPSYAYQVKCEDKNILFTGDLDKWFSDFPEVALNEEFDLIFCEATHYPPEKAVPVLMQAKTKSFVFYHIHDPWHGDGEQTLLDYYKELPFPVKVAHDLDEFEL